MNNNSRGSEQPKTYEESATKGEIRTRRLPPTKPTDTVEQILFPHLQEFKFGHFDKAIERIDAHYRSLMEETLKRLKKANDKTIKDTGKTVYEKHWSNVDKAIQREKELWNA